MAGGKAVSQFERVQCWYANWAALLRCICLPEPSTYSVVLAADGRYPGTRQERWETYRQTRAERNEYCAALAGN